MPRCTICESVLAKAEQHLPQYIEKVAGIPVVLLNCVESYTCPQHPDEQAFTHVPDQEDLEAAVAVARIQIPQKLNGKEIRFLRKVAGWTAKEFAAQMNISEEVVSRWENGKTTIGPSSESKLRLIVGIKIKEKDHKAPGVYFDPLEVASLKLEPVRDSGDTVRLAFYRGPVARENRRETTTDYVPEPERKRA
jgi:transcriptional regulator with XRE-family HTH domain